MNLNINNKQVIEAISQMMYKKYAESLRETKLEKVILFRHFQNSGYVNRLDEITLMIMEDPSKWSFLKFTSCPN